LKERLNFSSKIGCAQCIIGATIIVIHAPASNTTETLPEFFRYALAPGFIVYCLLVAAVVFYLIYKVSPVYGDRHPIVYISICSLVGSFLVLSVQGLGSAIAYSTRHWNDDNQFLRWDFYILLCIVIITVIGQVHFLNKALNQFSTAIVSPVYYVGFTSCTLISSAVLFRGFAVESVTSGISLVMGFFVIVGGVALLFQYSIKLGKLSTAHTREPLSRAYKRSQRGNQSRNLNIENLNGANDDDQDDEDDDDDEDYDDDDDDDDGGDRISGMGGRQVGENGFENEEDDEEDSVGPLEDDYNPGADMSTSRIGPAGASNATHSNTFGVSKLPQGKDGMVSVSRRPQIVTAGSAFDAVAVTIPDSHTVGSPSTQNSRDEASTISSFWKSLSSKLTTMSSPKGSHPSNHMRKKGISYGTTDPAPSSLLSSSSNHHAAANLTGRPIAQMHQKHQEAIDTSRTPSPQVKATSLATDEGIPPHRLPPPPSSPTTITTVRSVPLPHIESISIVSESVTAVHSAAIPIKQSKPPTQPQHLNLLSTSPYSYPPSSQSASLSSNFADSTFTSTSSSFQTLDANALVKPVIPTSNQVRDSF
jgi:hypothetical protein